MTEALFVVIGGLLAIAAAATVAPRIGIASPLLLVLLGIGVSFLPFVPDVEVEPHWILTVVLPQEAIDRLVEVAKTDTISIDLEHQTVTTPFQDRFHFEIDAFRKSCLIGGLDEVGLTMARGDAIATFERMDADRRPWLVPAAD